MERTHIQEETKRGQNCGKTKYLGKSQPIGRRRRGEWQTKIGRMSCHLGNESIPYPVSGMYKYCMLLKVTWPNDVRSGRTALLKCRLHQNIDSNTSFGLKHIIRMLLIERNNIRKCVRHTTQNVSRRGSTQKRTLFNCSRCCYHRHRRRCYVRMHTVVSLFSDELYITQHTILD